MSFIWPFMLLTLALIPLGVALYYLIERGRRRRLAAYGGSLVAQETTHRTTGLRGRVPPALLVCGLIVMSVAMARPQAVISLPRQEGTVILAFDVSGSMAATDLKPTRMDAAKAAAKDFVSKQPSSVTIGVVAFSDGGISVQTPTNDQATVLAAIDRLAPQHGTSLGQGILASLDAIAVAEAGPYANNYYSNVSPAPTAAPTPTPVPSGTHAPAVIVLLSDGENNENPDPQAAAQTAADRGVRIYTVGIGSPSGTTVTIDGFQLHTQLDQATLQGISQTTGGTYYAAADEQQLFSVYDNLDTQLVVQPQLTEITSVLAGLSLVLLIGGALTSLLWLGRLL
ncbi:MAG: VWA domain-containing protein [Candidatus Limnocylindrales bacterium]|jgi:Ca-activated chloride channel family protein